MVSSYFIKLYHRLTRSLRYDAWNLAANTKEIFIRDRDTDLNVLDGVRALAYIWVFNGHLLEMMGSIINGFKTWELSLSGNTYFSLGNQYKGDQGVTSFFVLSGIYNINPRTRFPHYSN